MMEDDQMKRFADALTTACWIVLTLICGRGPAITLWVPSDGGYIVPPGESWRFFRGTGPASALADAWRQVDFNDSSWSIGLAGFGYGDGDDA
ncbi:MAG TPA: hypothetical protein PK373_10065, partial [Sedimentisphaerales bacterium]|nr:hypothetical protein [Sedimentisphaerales bacterium]